MAGHSSIQIPVELKIKTTIHHQDDDKPEVYELIASGNYQKKASAAYLRYDEAMDVGTVNTTVKVTERDLLILRNGPVKMRMVFQPGQAVSGTYHSPHGLLEIITEADSLESFHNDQTNEGFINLQYNLTMQDTMAGTYQVEIKYKEEGK